MKLIIFCNHYRAMAEHNTCKAGIAYDTMKGVPFDQRPCFWRRRTQSAPPCGCDRAEFPTDEQIAADEAETRRHYQDTALARNAIVASLGGPWKRGDPSASGSIDCPVCSAKASLGFSRSGYNGHIHARCATIGCVAWME